MHKLRMHTSVFLRPARLTRTPSHDAARHLEEPTHKVFTNRPVAIEDYTARSFHPSSPLQWCCGVHERWGICLPRRGATRAPRENWIDCREIPRPLVAQSGGYFANMRGIFPPPPFSRWSMRYGCSGYHDMAHARKVSCYGCRRGIAPSARDMSGEKLALLACWHKGKGARNGAGQGMHTMRCFADSALQLSRGE